MNVRIAALLIRGLVGGLWGLLAVIAAYMFYAWLPMFSLLFHPLIFAGAVPAAVLFSGKNVTAMRAVFIGLVSGLIYQLLSPISPLLASVLAGASLGGGLAENSDKPVAIPGLILRTLRGALILPLIILTGTIVSGPLYLITQAPLYHWLFWGTWVALGIRLISGPGNEGTKESNLTGNSTLRDFRSEAGKIVRELSELNFKLDL